jgi:predicted site-specific integrase-resolvase
MDLYGTSDTFVSPSFIIKKFRVSRSSLANWSNQGKIRANRTPGGNRLYSYRDVSKLLGGSDRESEEVIQKKERIVYCRVSSSHQKEDLKRQISDLSSKYPEHRVVQDVGSGLNFKRQGLQTILELLFKRAISELVVAYRDRLCRFGFELFGTLCKEHEVKLVVQYGSLGSEENELAQDLLAITNYFVAKNNGKRAAEARKRRREEKGTIPEQIGKIRECKTKETGEEKKG